MLYAIPLYDALRKVLDDAFNQAAWGKGKERHASPDEPFEKQPICEMARRLGPEGPLYQATKKIYESKRLDDEEAVTELLGAINYIAAAIIMRREGEAQESPGLKFKPCGDRAVDTQREGSADGSGFLCTKCYQSGIERGKW